MSKSQVDELLESYPDSQQSSSPVIIVKKGNLIIELSESTIKNYTIEVLNYVMEDIRKQSDFGKNYGTIRALIELKKAWWPATQKQITTNIDLFNEKLKSWYFTNEDNRKMEEERKQNIKNEGVIEQSEQTKLEI